MPSFHFTSSTNTVGHLWESKFCVLHKIGSVNFFLLCYFEIASDCRPEKMCLQVSSKLIYNLLQTESVNYSKVCIKVYWMGDHHLNNV